MLIYWHYYYYKMNWSEEILLHLNPFYCEPLHQDSIPEKEGSTCRMYQHYVNLSCYANLYRIYIRSNLHFSCHIYTTCIVVWQLVAPDNTSCITSSIAARADKAWNSICTGQRSETRSNVKNRSDVNLKLLKGQRQTN